MSISMPCMSMTCMSMSSMRIPCHCLAALALRSWGCIALYCIVVAFNRHVLHWCCITLHGMLHYLVWHVALPCMACCITLHGMLHYLAWHVALPCMACCITLYGIALHSIGCRCIALALHCHAVALSCIQSTLYCLVFNSYSPNPLVSSVFECMTRLQKREGGYSYEARGVL